MYFLDLVVTNKAIQARTRAKVIFYVLRIYKMEANDMKKANKIIKDLKHLKGKTFFGGACTVDRNERRSKNLEIGATDLVEALKPYEINFKALYKVDFDDVVYNDSQGNYESIDLNITSNNSYNWNAQVAFNFNEIEVIDRYGMEHKYITVKFHRYGDVRGNYTDYMVLDMSLDEFYEVLQEASRVYCDIDYKGVSYSISTDILRESGVFDIYSDGANIDEYGVCLDIDNLRSKKDIKKALIQYLKENK